ncbi:hypothetical protein B9Z51_15245 [Limnohabitans sp. T6-5]|nr:hypothetical protein B9Z51_15245 [Limnohabitans sp. T6-5]
MPPPLIRVSAPAPPHKVFWPSPAFNRSLLSPPSSQSLPLSALRVSLPASPFKVLAPSPATRLSSPAPPVN